MHPNRRNRYKQQFEDLGRGEAAPKWKPKEGKNLIRILPPYDPNNTGKPDFYKQWMAVFNLGKDQNRMVVPRSQFGDKDCAFQAWYDEVCSGKDDASQQLAHKYRPVQNFAMFIIDRANVDAGPQCWYTTLKNIRRILEICCNDQYGDVVLPVPDEDGTGAIDLEVSFTPQGKTKTGFAEYSIDPQRLSSPLGTPEQIAEWCSEDLFEKYQIGHPSDNEWIKAVLEGREDEYIESRQGGNAGAKSAEPAKTETQASPPPPPAPTATPPPVPTEEERVIRYPDKASPADSWWMVSADNKTVPITVEDIGKLVLAGEDPLCMPRGGKEWAKASVYGFDVVVSAPSPPQSPPPPPSDDVAPPPPSADMSMEERMKKKMEEAMKFAKEQTADAQDAEAKLA